ncbi:MAG: hypothetical protein K6E92_01495 [Lachnospiraceae bacterium]|nr:hypothetical protein [Lachnospiraceae bacterium]
MQEQQGQRTTNFSGTIGTNPAMIQTLAEGLIRLPEFKNALKEMKLEKLTATDLKRFLLTDHAKKLTEEFDRQQKKIEEANEKKAQANAKPKPQKEGPKVVKSGPSTGI